MKIINWYILKKCFLNTLLMLSAFIMLFFMVTVISQISDLGHGNYNIVAILIYTILLIPNSLYLLLPLAVLIGVILAMLNLVNYSEYTIIRTSGVSLRYMMIILCMYGVFWTIMMFIVGEIIAPVTNNYAEVYKSNKTHVVISTQLNSGMWSKDGAHTFVNIKQIQPDSTINNINIFHYDDAFKLNQYILAESGVYNIRQASWILSNVTEYQYTLESITKTMSAQYVWHTTLEPQYLNILVVQPNDMSALSLNKYIEHLTANHQAAKSYMLAFWNRIIDPFACIIMALIALGFIPNNRRNINLGAKLFAGILLGISFFFISKLTNFVTLIFGLNIIFAAILPDLIFLIIALIILFNKE